MIPGASKKLIQRFSMFFSFLNSCARLKLIVKLISCHSVLIKHWFLTHLQSRKKDYLATLSPPDGSFQSLTLSFNYFKSIPISEYWLRKISQYPPASAFNDDRYINYIILHTFFFNYLNISPWLKSQRITFPYFHDKSLSTAISYCYYILYMHVMI